MDNKSIKNIFGIKNESEKEAKYGFFDIMTDIISWFSAPYRFIIKMIFRAIKFLGKKGLNFIIYILNYIWDNISIAMNEIFNKYYGNSSYYDILKISFNPVIFTKLIESTKKEMKDAQSRDPSSKDMGFPLPRIIDEPESVTFPSMIKLIMQTLFTLIISCIMILIISIIGHIVYLFIEFNDALYSETSKEPNRINKKNKK